MKGTEKEMAHYISLHFDGLNQVTKPTTDTGGAHRVFPFSGSLKYFRSSQGRGALEWVWVSKAILFSSKRVSVLMTQVRSTSIKDQMKNDKMPSFG